MSVSTQAPLPPPPNEKPRRSFFDGRHPRHSGVAINGVGNGNHELAGYGDGYQHGQGQGQVNGYAGEQRGFATGFTFGRWFRYVALLFSYLQRPWFLDLTGADGVE